MKTIGNAIKKYFKTADILLLCLAIVISAFGLVTIYGATRYLNTNRYVEVQALAILGGIVGFFIISIIDTRRFPRLWVILFVLNVLFQLSLIMVPEDINGNRSWINLGPINVQPGEVGKIIFIFTLASHIQMLKDKLNHPLSILQLGAHMGITTLAVFIISKDLGVAILYPLIFFVVLFACGVSWGWLLAGIAAMGGLAIPMWSMMSEIQKARILVIFDPTISIDRYWHTQQSLDALARGGLTGVGLGNNKPFVYNHSDFIFSSLGEQFGFIGAGIMIILLCLLVLRIFAGGVKSEDLFGRAICMGIGGMFMVQILINAGMCMGVMPVIGITLPLVSYGGTSMLFTLASLGLVSGARIKRRPQWLRNTE